MRIIAINDTIIVLSTVPDREAIFTGLENYRGETLERTSIKVLHKGT